MANIQRVDKNNSMVCRSLGAWFSLVLGIGFEFSLLKVLNANSLILSKQLGDRWHESYWRE